MGHSRPLIIESMRGPVHGLTTFIFGGSHAEAGDIEEIKVNGEGSSLVYQKPTTGIGYYIFIGVKWDPVAETVYGNLHS